MLAARPNLHALGYVRLGEIESSYLITGSKSPCIEDRPPSAVSVTAVSYALLRPELLRVASYVAATNHSQQGGLSSELDAFVHPVVSDMLHSDNSRGEKKPSGCGDRPYDPRSGADSQRGRPVERDRRAGMARMDKAPMGRTLALVGKVEERLRDVGRRVDFVDNDINEARDLVTEAAIRSLDTETTVAAFAWRLERLENAILRDQRPPDPPRPPRHRGRAMHPRYIHLRREKRRVILLKTPDK